MAGQTHKTLTIKMQNTYIIDHQDTGKGTVAVPKDLQHQPAKHTPYPLNLPDYISGSLIGLMDWLSMGKC